MILASWGRSGDRQEIAAEGHKAGQDTAALLRFSTHQPHQQQAVGVQGMIRILLPIEIDI